MKTTEKVTILSLVILLSLLSSLVFSTRVLADDITPPPVETPEVLPPAEKAVGVETLIPEVTSEASNATEDSVSTEPATDGGSAIEETGGVDLSRIVQTAAGKDLTLADSGGYSLSLSTVEAAETLATGDPYIVRGGVTYSFMPIGGCGVLPNCTESATPIQVAVNFALASETIFVEAGTYHEQLVINTANLTLYGDPGNLTVAGVGPNAPILDGSGVSGDTGIKIYAEGFTLRGFIIQNFDTAVFQQTLSGNNTVTYDNLVIQNNIDGIKVEKAGGSPGIQMHYIVFQNNSGIDLINVDPNGNNVQFINANNNYWGCSSGPVVRHVRTGQGGDDPAGEVVYYLWSQSDAPKNLFLVNYPNEYGDCALLYGNDSLYNNNGQGGTYDPYKIVIGTIETTRETNTPALTIVKTATPTTYSAVGQVISYSYFVTNTGNVTLAGPVTVTDNKATVTCPAGGLASGASMTCTASYSITQADLDSGSVTNTARASANGIDSNEDSETVTVVRSPALTIVKTATPTTYSVVGQVINYSYLVINTGNVTISGPFVVGDDKSNDESCPIILSLVPGASFTCTASYTIKQADLDAGSVTNIAFATSGAVTSPADTETVTAVRSPVLTIVKTATPTTYSAVGQVINYSYLVTNASNITLSGPFIVSDDKSNDESCPIILSLVPGASFTCTASYTITQADLDAGSVTNIASASNGTVTSPTDTETVTAIQGPSLATVKTETSNGPYAVGNTITYNIVATNTGNVTLTGVTVTDNNAVLGTCTPAQPSTLGPGASMTCSASHIVTQANVNSGSYINIATGDSDQTTPNTSTVTVNFTPANPPIRPTITPTNPAPVRPSVSFTGFIPVTGGDTHVIAAGIAHTCAIMPEGDVRCWGNNDFGQLGNGTQKGSNIPVDVIGIGGGTTIVAGGNHTCILSGGDVWCWGQNSQGQLGDGTRKDRNIPVKVLSNVQDITAGLDYTCAIMNYGQVMCWGNNDQGQLADGTRMDRSFPVLASLISSISNVDAGRNQSCGLTGAGLLRCLSGGSAQDLGGVIPEAGHSPEIYLDVAVNRFGPLVMALIEDGVPVAFQGSQFQAVNDVRHALDVDSGLGHVCALIEDGTVSCWGSNYYGQLGRNSKTSSPNPQRVLNVSSAWQLAVGKNHACVLITSAISGTDDIQCWGLNSDGQLGNGTYVNSPIPVFVK